MANLTSPEQSDARTLRIVLCLMGLFRDAEARGRVCKVCMCANERYTCFDYVSLEKAVYLQKVNRHEAIGGEGV